MTKVKNKKNNNNNNDHYVGALLESMDSKIDALVDGHKFLVDGQKVLESKMKVLEIKMMVTDGKVDDLKSEMTRRFNKLDEKESKDEFVVLEKRVTTLERARA